MKKKPKLKKKARSIPLIRIFGPGPVTRVSGTDSFVRFEFDVGYGIIAEIRETLEGGERYLRLRSNHQALGIIPVNYGEILVKLVEDQ